MRITVASWMAAGAVALAAATSGGVAAADTAQTPGISTFRSPSANIGCVLYEGSARCDVRDRTWTPPPAPPNCDTHIVDYGQGVEVDPTGPGRLVCAGDTALDPSAQPLAYGTSTVVGAIRCDSAPDGMSCLNTADGHGFWISAQGYRVY